MAEEKEESEQEIPEEETTEEPKKKKKKKVVRRRKTKKEKEKPITAALRLAVESGNVQFGARSALKASLLKKAKMFVVAGNTPRLIKERVGHYASISEIPLIEFEGTTLELGSVCGKPFPVSVLSVFDPGTSLILEMKK